MTLVQEAGVGHADSPDSHIPRRTNLLGYLRTTSHKDIAVMYFVTSFGFFLFAGVLAIMMRAELARPGLQYFSNEQYNQFFTMHGTLMLLMF
ncbi:cbb3-type cytochrome c oxidase subunit I, partial [Frankia sp. CcI156]